MPAGAADRSRNEKERPKKEHGLDCTDNSCGTGFAGSRGSMRSGRNWRLQEVSGRNQRNFRSITWK